MHFFRQMSSLLGSLTSDKLSDACKAAADAVSASLQKRLFLDFLVCDNLHEASKVAAGTFLHVVSQSHSSLHFRTHSSQARPCLGDLIWLEGLRSAQNQTDNIVHFLILVRGCLQQQATLGSQNGFHISVQF